MANHDDIRSARAPMAWDAPAPRPGDFTLTLSDDSMAPTLHAGDRLTFRPIDHANLGGVGLLTDVEGFRHGGVCAVRDASGAQLIGRCHVGPDPLTRERDTLTLRRDKPGVADVRIPLAQLGSVAMLIEARRSCACPDAQHAGSLDTPPLATVARLINASDDRVALRTTHGQHWTHAAIPALGSVVELKRRVADAESTTGVVVGLTPTHAWVSTYNAGDCDELPIPYSDLLLHVAAPDAESYAIRADDAHPEYHPGSVADTLPAVRFSADAATLHPLPAVGLHVDIDARFFPPGDGARDGRIASFDRCGAMVDVGGGESVAVPWRFLSAGLACPWERAPTDAERASIDAA